MKFLNFIISYIFFVCCLLFLFCFAAVVVVVVGGGASVRACVCVCVSFDLVLSHPIRVKRL